MAEKNSISPKRRESRDSQSKANHVPNETPPAETGNNISPVSSNTNTMSEKPPISRSIIDNLPNMTITPVSKRTKESGRSQSKPSGSASKPHFPIPFQGVRNQKTTLRPANMNAISCSIHCPNVTSPIPSLSCNSCHEVFHPTCLGLPDLAYDDTYEFFCYKCNPPKQSTRMDLKENEKPFCMTKLPKGLSIIPSSQKKLLANGGGSRSPSNVKRFGASLSQNNSKLMTPSQTSKLIDSQTVVNIAGVKYLVVPTPESQRINKSVRHANNTHIPVLLKPAESGAMPSFEVEQMTDGTLILVPTTNLEGKNPFSKKNEVINKTFNNDRFILC